MGKHLVLVGGGHAHMTVLSRLNEFTHRGHQVTLVSPSPYHYYSGMGPGLLAGTYRPQDVRFHVRRMAEDRGADFVADTVLRVDPGRCRLHLASGRDLAYDVVSFNTGSHVPLESVGASGEGIFPVKPICNLYRARQDIRRLLPHRSLRLLLVGGGPAGVEMAGNLRRLVDDEMGRAEIVLVGGSRILKGLPGKVRRHALRDLQGRGVEVREGVRATEVRDGRASLDDGTSLAYDFAFIAVGVVPSPLFRDSGLPTGADGGLRVNRFLQNGAHPELFGGGDCISFDEQPLDKVGVYAVRQNPVLFHNLRAALESGELTPFEPQSDYLLIFNLGDGRGIFRRKGWVWDGPPAFWLKDWIDRRFMKRFQLSGEGAEEDRPGRSGS